MADKQSVDMFLMTNGQYLPFEHVVPIKQKLYDLKDESKWFMVSTLQFKDPTIVLLLSLFFGGFGVDRFYIGDIGMGVIKLLTCGGLGIWTIVDWFIIMSTTKKANYNNLKSALY